MRKTKVKNDGSREFRPSLLTRLGILIIAGFFLLVAAVIVKNNVSAPWHALVCGVPIFAFLGWFAIVQATQLSVTVRDEGLEYRFGSGTVLATWDNLVRFARRDSGRASTVGLLLRDKVHQQVKGGRLERAFIGDEPVNYIPLSDIVPVPTVYDKEKKQRRVNTEKFAKTPFGQELLHYAPHLFEERASQIREITK